jgi:hypothetical protein
MWCVSRLKKCIRTLTQQTNSSMTQGLIDRILIPTRYNIFLKVHLQRTLGLSVFGVEQFRNESTTEKSFQVCTSEDKIAQKRLTLVCDASL